MTRKTPISLPTLMRRNKNPSHRHGVITGSALIDMACNLSRSIFPLNWALSLWIQHHYIDPFNRINRLDGIIVASNEDMNMLLWAHQKYCLLSPYGAGWLPPLPPVLWVPGLEPLSRRECEIGLEVDQVEWETEAVQVIFEGAEMYGRKGERGGVHMGGFVDGLGWERELWELPGNEEQRSGKRKRKEVTKSGMEEEKLTDTKSIAWEKSDEMVEEQRPSEAEEPSQGFEFGRESRGNRRKKQKLDNDETSDSEIMEIIDMGPSEEHMFDAQAQLESDGRSESVEIVEMAVPKKRRFPAQGQPRESIRMTRERSRNVNVGAHVIEVIDLEEEEEVFVKTEPESSPGIVSSPHRLVIVISSDSESD